VDHIGSLAICLPPSALLEFILSVPSEGIWSEGKEQPKMDASIAALIQAWNKDPNLCLNRVGDAYLAIRNFRREY
jgi:hypothetical protein